MFLPWVYSHSFIHTAVPNALQLMVISYITELPQLLQQYPAGISHQATHAYTTFTQTVPVARPASPTTQASKRHTSEGHQHWSPLRGRRHMLGTSCCRATTPAAPLQHCVARPHTHSRGRGLITAKTAPSVHAVCTGVAASDATPNRRGSGSALTPQNSERVIELPHEANHQANRSDTLHKTMLTNQAIASHIALLHTATAAAAGSLLGKTGGMYEHTYCID